MGGMPMPGGGPFDAALAFMLMWVGMTVVMMLPTLVPVLLAYHRSSPILGRAGRLVATGLVAVAYFAVWVLFGIFCYGLTIAVRSGSLASGLARYGAWGIGILLLLTGFFQFTAFKRRYLGRCRTRLGETTQGSTVRSGWDFGARLGADCVVCCLGLMLCLLAIGMAQVEAMALVGIAITLERLTPWPRAVARLTGVVVILVGVGGMVKTLS
jgi:predicted metal-binding membrane protein